MGGCGSGWQGPKRATVEDSLVLSVSALMRAGVLVPRRAEGRAVGLDLRGRKPAPRGRDLRGGPHGARLSVAPASLLRGRRAGGLYGAAGEHAAELWRPPLVVPLPVEWSPRGEALPAAGRQALREPRGLRADLRVLPGEWEPAHRVHRRRRGRERPAGSQGDAHTGLHRRETAERRPRHGRAVVQAFWAGSLTPQGPISVVEMIAVSSQWGGVSKA